MCEGSHEERVLLFMILVIEWSGGRDLLFSTSEVIARFADVGC